MTQALTKPSIENLREASSAVYLACEKIVADDISNLLKWSAERVELLETSEANEIARLRRMASEMRNAIDMIEGAMMGAGELIDIPSKFEDARDDLLVMPKITLGQLRRITRSLSECTRIINSNEYDPETIAVASHNWGHEAT